MKMPIFTLMLAVAFAAASSMAVYAFTCEVKDVNGATVTLECKEKYAQKLDVGGKAKVRVPKERKIEGC